MQQVNYRHSNHVVLALENLHAPAAAEHHRTGLWMIWKRVWCCVMKTAGFHVSRIFVEIGDQTTHHRYNSIFLVNVSSTDHHLLHHHSHIFCPTAVDEILDNRGNDLVHGVVI